MLNWKLVTFLVCCFGFFKDLRPSEAYLTAYLKEPRLNLTDKEINNEIYPWWTYSYLLWLLPVFLLTDYLLYKPMLVLVGVAYIATWALLLWAKGVPAMKCMQVIYGLATAGEIGYSSYLYAIVSNEYFAKVASFTKAASLFGKFAAYLCGQLFVSFDVMDYFQLNIFSFVSVIIAFLISMFLPRAQYSELFNPRKPEPWKELHTVTDTPTISAESKDNNNASKTHANALTFRNTLDFFKSELKTMYSSKHVLIWSIWWAFASCGNFQVGNYIQNLWSILTPYQDNKSKKHLYNGAVEAAGTMLSALVVLLVGFLPINWSVRGRCEWLMATVCGLNAALLIVMGKATNIWITYVFYDVFRATYQIVITIATAQIATQLTVQRYGFVFGCNTFLALLIETILTAIVVDENGLAVGIQTQFIVYGGYFAAMTLAFLIVAMVTLIRSHKIDRETYRPFTQETIH